MTKTEEAKRVVEKCMADDGFRASADIYPELYMRDLVFSEDALLKLGYEKTIKRQFETFLGWQRKNGQIPSVITDPLRRIFNQRFVFWTSDTEILFLLGTRKYAEFTGDSGFLETHAEQLDRCLRFVEMNLNRFGLIPGMDWRDALMPTETSFYLRTRCCSSICTNR